MWKSQEQVEQWEKSCSEAAEVETQKIWKEARIFVEQQLKSSEEPTYSTLVAAYMQTRATLVAMHQTSSYLENISFAVKDVADK